MRAEAYPNYSDVFDTGQTYDLQKWADTFKNIYIKMHFGTPKTDAINDLTKDWNKIERKDFINWMKYYESGDYLKYKQAQLKNRYYVNDDLNYFVPNPPVSVPSPLKTINDQIAAAPQLAEQTVIPPSTEDRRKLIEEQRKKILGRLNSVEKLLSSPQGHVFAGPEFERILHSIYELKKQIQVANKVSLSAQTCVDLIIRQAAILHRQGHKSAAKFMVKLAQNTPGDFSLSMNETPAAGSQPQGLGALDNQTPGIDQMMKGSEPSADTSQDDAISAFLENMETGGLGDDDSNEAEDEVVIDDDDVLLDKEVLAWGKNDLIVEAQDLSPAQPLAPKPQAPKELEVEEKPTEGKQDVDSKIDSALANMTLADAVQELEEISFIFKNREIVRKLSIADMILNKLDIGQYFTELGETIQKNLDCAQYSISRLENILSRLRGGMDAYKTQLDTTPPENKGGLQQHFQGEENKDRERKELRKRLQDQELTEKSKPEATVEAPQNELAAAPTQVEAPAPRPTPPPAAPVV